MHRNLRREFLTVDELLGKLRAEGVEDVREVRKAYLESGGEFSVIKRSDESIRPTGIPRV